MFYHAQEGSSVVNGSIEGMSSYKKENEESGELFEVDEDRSLCTEGIQEKGEGVPRSEGIQENDEGELMSEEKMGSWVDEVMVYQGDILYEVK